MAKFEVELPTDIERLLGFPLESNPGNSKFSVPDVPEGVVSHPVGYITIDPKMARDWVTHRLYLQSHTPKKLRHEDQRHNRIVSVSYVKKWKNIFLNGEWDPFVPGDISITPDGYILDGQHRLGGAFLAGVTFTVSVRVQVPWDTFAKTDTGLGRAPSQFLHGYPYRSTVGGAVRHIIPVLNHAETRRVVMRARDGEEMLDVAGAFPWLRGGQVKDCTYITKNVFIPAGILCGHTTMALAAGASYDHVQEFLNGVLFGVNVSRDDPRYVLREKFVKMNNLRTRERQLGQKESHYQQIMQVSHVREALTSWLENKPLKNFSFKGNILPVWNADAVRLYFKEKTE